VGHTDLSIAEVNEVKGPDRVEAPRFSVVKQSLERIRALALAQADVAPGAGCPTFAHLLG
jgi:hypothetical protein